MIHYLKGDATVPQASGNKIIAHVCNDCGGWGKGFVLAVSRRWPQPERDYRDWYNDKARSDFRLGEVQLVSVKPDIWIANMIGQHGMRAGSGGPPVRYDAIEACLTKVASEASRLKASVHMPRIGCGLAGGKWEKVEPLIELTLCAAKISVYVYDF